jgi:hypothetical protein
MILRKEEEITEDHFQTLATVGMSAGLFAWLLEDFTRRVKDAFPGE